VALKVSASALSSSAAGRAFLSRRGGGLRHLLHLPYSAADVLNSAAL